jgi:hypothetical protein
LILPKLLIFNYPVTKKAFMGKTIRIFCFTLALVALWCCLASLEVQAQEDTSDPKAIALADKVIKNMGGAKAWNNTRYLAWGWRDQYHVWDKFENNFRWEKDTLVVVANLNTREGKAYSKGKDISETAAGKKLIQNIYPVWANNSYWFIMPYKLRDKGVTLKYKGPGQTKAGEEADLVELTFKEVGVTPNNRYILAIDKKSGLITEWSFFRNYADPKPGFTMAWTDYRPYGKIKLSAGRGEDAKMGMTHIAVAQQLPANVFNSPMPIKKL